MRHFLFADGSVRFVSYDAAPLMPAFASHHRRRSGVLALTTNAQSSILQVWFASLDKHIVHSCRGRG